VLQDFRDLWQTEFQFERSDQDIPASMEKFKLDSTLTLRQAYTTDLSLVEEVARLFPSSDIARHLSSSSDSKSSKRPSSSDSKSSKRPKLSKQKQLLLPQYEDSTPNPPVQAPLVRLVHPAPAPLVPPVQAQEAPLVLRVNFFCGICE